MKTDHQAAFLERLNPRTIEAVWHDHCAHCERCKQWKEAEPTTLAHVCPEGVNYVKVIIAKHAPKKKRELVERDKFWASKEQIKAAMRYK